MDPWEITCVRQSNGVITHVNVGGLLQPVERVLSWIQNEKFPIHTYKNGYRADVYPKQNSYTGRWFLTTDPDNTRENNLDFLPPC